MFVGIQRPGYARVWAIARVLQQSGFADAATIGAFLARLRSAGTAGQVLAGCIACAHIGLRSLDDDNDETGSTQEVAIQVVSSSSEGH